MVEIKHSLELSLLRQLHQILRPVSLSHHWSIHRPLPTRAPRGLANCLRLRYLLHRHRSSNLSRYVLRLVLVLLGYSLGLIMQNMGHVLWLGLDHGYILEIRVRRWV